MDEELINLFMQINAASDIQARFITQRQAETNHLEFKEKSDPRTPDLSEFDRKNFSKTLSSFSNSDGGILIWGIRTRRRDGRDVAWTLKPITQAAAMAERLRDMLLDTLMPQNPLVKVEAISNRLGNGYVKCLIPASSNPPHRAMVDREYWVRLDGRSVRLEHYIIRDMMLRHALPDLQFSAVVKPGDDLAGNQVRVAFRMINAGRAIAKYAGWMAIIQTAKVVAAEGCEDQSRANAVPTIFWEARNDTVLHPNGIFHQVGSLVLEYLDTHVPIAIRVTFYCEGMTAKVVSFTFNYPPPVEQQWRYPAPDQAI